jgi:undecaprenyl diphosphate synthase
MLYNAKRSVNGSSVSAAPLRLAIILDGNGRWAERRGLARPMGHRAGVDAVRQIVEAAPGLGVDALTLYAFSSDNWKRPRTETTALMGLLGRWVRRETGALRRSGVRLRLIGRRDRLPQAVRQAVARCEWETRHGTRLDLRLAVDYAGRDALVRAAARAGEDEGFRADPSREAFARHLGAVLAPCTADEAEALARPVDLLIRTGGERRLSDFLLWEAAYAELAFDDTLWPDFTPDHLARHLDDFHGRDRRFGGLSRSAKSSVPRQSVSA